MAYSCDWIVCVKSKMKKKSVYIYFIFGLFFGLHNISAEVQSVNGRYMTDWLILGPISGIDLEKDYLSKNGGESQIEPKEGDKFETNDDRILTWTRYRSPQDFVDFLVVSAVGVHGCQQYPQKMFGAG